MLWYCRLQKSVERVKWELLTKRNMGEIFSLRMVNCVVNSKYLMKCFFLWYEIQSRERYNEKSSGSFIGLGRKTFLLWWFKKFTNILKIIKIQCLKTHYRTGSLMLKKTMFETFPKKLFSIYVYILLDQLLTVCEAPCIVCVPFVHAICGIGLAPAVEHDKCTFTPDVKGWFSPWMWI